MLWKNWLKVCLLILVMGGLGLAVAWPRDLYCQFESPEGGHRLLVYRFTVPLMFPGQSGDAPGKVVLEDAAGKVLRHTWVEMVQNVESPEWTERSVRVKLLLDWEF